MFAKWPLLQRVIGDAIFWLAVNSYGLARRGLIEEKTTHFASGEGGRVGGLDPPPAAKISPFQVRVDPPFGLPDRSFQVRPPPSPITPRSYDT